ncbi:MAG: amidohydrolase family protein [Vulcanimicrobiota bacterium]
MKCLWLSLWLACAAWSEPIYVRAGRLIDPGPGVVMRDQLVTIEGERILSVSPYHPVAKMIDWSDRTVLPGLIDLHTHLADVGQTEDVALPRKTSPAATALLGALHARQTLAAGFTSVRDVGTYRAFTDVALRDAIAAGSVPGPRMWVAGAYLTCPGGGGELNGVGDLPEDMRFGVGRGPEQIGQRAQALFEGHADFLKLIVTGAVLALNTEVGEVELHEEEVRAAVEVARSNGSYATAHAHGAVGIKTAIRAGVRSVEHASLIDDEGIALARERGVWLVMDIYNGDYIESVGRQQGWPDDYLRKNQETTELQRQGFARAVKAGVRLGYGTDAGVFPHGLNARQFAYMVRYGMTPMQALRSATVEAAELMGQGQQLGRLAPGFYADMIAVKGNPLEDIRILELPPMVMKGGQLQ